MKGPRDSQPIVGSKVPAQVVPIAAALLLAVVLGCGSGNGGGNGAAGSGNGGSGTAGTGGTTGSGGSGVCAVACTTGRNCCGGGCVNLQNDPFNCGTCGNRCEGNTAYCGDGTCRQPPCDPQTELCSPNSICCGSTCCPAGDICCDKQGPIPSAPSCFTPTATEPTCPKGCAPLCMSDRSQKKNIAPADTDAILKKVSELPISTWTYLEEPAAVRHLGPMAQDFHARFGLGNDDRTYHSVDAHGVALAAIQALDHVVKQQEQRIEKLERENRALGQRLSALGGRSQPGGDRR